jgi:hypothetical protein
MATRTRTKGAEMTTQEQTTDAVEAVGAEAQRREIVQSGVADAKGWPPRWLRRPTPPR